MKPIFFSLFLNTQSYHQKYLYDNLFNMNETYIKLAVRLTLAIIRQALPNEKNIFFPHLGLV
jgi:hypothetical protein